MEASDDRLLEYYYSEGAAGVGKVHKSGLLNYSYETIRRRSKLLAEAGLLEKIGEGSYAITNLGIRYLEGETGLRDIENPEDDS